MSSGSVPRMPDFDLKRLHWRRQKSQDALQSIFAGASEIETEMLGSLAEAARKALKVPKKYEHTVRDSLTEFVGAPTTFLTLDRMSLKLAGGYPFFKKGQLFHKPQRLVRPMWAPIEIAEMRYGHIRYGRLYLEMRGLVMATSLAGSEISQAIPARFAVTVFAGALGWPRFGTRPLHNLMVRMWFLGKLSNHAHARVGFGEFKCLPHQQRHNRKLNAERAEPCLLGYRQQCASCPIGYIKCARGTHRYTWVLKPCQNCGTEKAAFDPEDPEAKQCLVCRNKAARAIWFKERKEAD